MYQKRAAVPHVRDLGPARVKEHRDDGRPRPAHRDLLRPHHVNAPARLLDRCPQNLTRNAALRSPLEHLEDGRQCELRGFTPASVPSHPVADDAEVAETRLVIAAGVLVDLLFRVPARIRPLCVLDGWQ